MLNSQAQSILIHAGLLDPDFDCQRGNLFKPNTNTPDGIWGAQSRSALKATELLMGLEPRGSLDSDCQQMLDALPMVPPPLVLGNSQYAYLAAKEMDRLGYFIARSIPRQPAYNICYIEGVDSGGRPNRDDFNIWNDTRMLFTVDAKSGRVDLVDAWLATTEPGAYYTYNPLNPSGAFRIAFGQYKAWRFGYHGRAQYPALVQSGLIAGYRDKNKDGFRTGDILVIGDDFGVNQHHGYDADADDVGRNSAGCLVGNSIAGHKNFMAYLGNDRRKLASQSYCFITAILDGSQIHK